MPRKWPVLFGEGPTEKDCNRSTSLAAYSTLRGRDGGNAILLPGTYVKVAGRWCYLYRAIDSDGTLWRPC